MKNQRIGYFWIAIVIITLVAASNAFSSDFMWGNLVLDKTAAEMKKANINPVIYPHWLHRTWFRCKVCHIDIVIDRKGGNDISMKKIQEGKVCGTCHNGTIAFDAMSKSNCKRCHSLSPDGTVDGPIFSPKNIPTQQFKDIAAKVGAVWNPEVLGGKGLPKDRFGFIDWIKMVDKGVVAPVYSLDKSEEDNNVRDTAVLIHPLSSYEDNVLFSHKVHTYWMKCEMCHDKIFKKKLGGNKIRMQDMVKNQNFCIHCHGKVSFPAANCIGCHKWEKGKPVNSPGEDHIIERYEKEDAVVVK